jgi:hypothetical protein
MTDGFYRLGELPPLGAPIEERIALALTRIAVALERTAAQGDETLAQLKRSVEINARALKISEAQLKTTAQLEQLLSGDTGTVQ